MVERLNVSGSQWVDVKAKLKVRDTRQIHSYSVDGMSSDGKTYRFNIVKYNIAHAAARITAWDGLKDGDKPIAYPSGKSFDDRIAAIESLDDEDFDAIATVINKRFNKNDDESVTEKNAQDGESS
jgi:hypothetical protein